MTYPSDTDIRPADAAAGAVWSIGDDSLDPRQFNAELLVGEADPAPFVIGRSDPRTDWPRMHPGPLDASSGFRSRSVSVQFVLDAGLAAAADGELALVLDLYASHGPCPQLRVSVGGLTGHYVLEPKRVSRRDAYARTSLVAGVVHLVAGLPAGALIVGDNEIVVTTVVDDPPDEDELVPARLPHLGTFFGSALTWRRLGLVRSTPSEPLVSLMPTPLYVDRAGELRELVDLRVRTASRVGRVGGTVHIGTEDHALPERPGVDFGDVVAARLAAAAFDEPVPATVDVALDGTSLHHETTLRPARRWTLHLMPHVHLDLGYTDSQGKVFELHNRNLDRAVDLVEEHDDFRFTIDGTITVGHYFAARSPARVADTLARFVDGHLGANAYSMLFLTGFAGLEELYRATYPALELAETHDVPIRHAHLTDVPSYSWAVPSTLRALGIDAFIGISNHTRGGNAESDELHLRSPLRWAGPDGAEVLAFFADCYSQLRFLCADPPMVTGMADGFSRLAARYDRDDYLPVDLPVVGTHADNEDLADGYAKLVQRWNDRYAYPRLRLSTFAEYVAAVRPLFDQLPTLTGDGGSYWEDHAGTQTGPIITLRAAQIGLAAADALSGLVAAHDERLAADRAALDRGWQHLVSGCEHTWTAAHATFRPASPAIADQLAWKTYQIESAWRVGIDEGNRAQSQLADLLALRHPQLVVVNPAARDRTVEVVCDLPATATVTDDRGVELAVELLAEPADGYAPVSVRVPDVPAFGYRVLTVGSGPEWAVPPLEPAASFSALGYDVAVDDGRVVRLRHRATGRELLDADSPYTLAEVLYVAGGGDAEGRGVTDPTSLFDVDPYLPQPELTVHRAATRLVGHAALPGGHLIRLEGSAPSLPEIRVDLRIRDDDTVDVAVRLRKEPELAKESVYVAFPFAANEPTVRYDRQIGWVDPARDHLPGACHEWFAVQRGVAVTGDVQGVVLATPDVPLVTLDLVRGTWATECRPMSGTVLSWIMNNYWWTNTAPSQQGVIELRYSFRPTAGWDEAAASRFVRDARTPALVNEVTPQDRTQPGEPVLAVGAGRLLDTELPENVDLSVHAGTTPGAVVVRVQEIGGRSAVARVRQPAGSAGRAWICDAAERRVAELVVDAAGWLEVPISRYAVVTVELGGSQR